MSKNYVEIEPGVGAGPVKIGMHRDSIQEAYRYVYSSFFKTDQSRFRSDHCGLAGFIAHYDSEGITKHIEIFNGENQQIEYEIYGVQAKLLTVRKLSEILEFKNIRFEISVYGVEARSIGLSTFNHDLQSKDDIIESFGIYSPLRDL